MNRCIVMLAFLLLTITVVSGQTNELKRFRVVSYNCENFFDCVDDSLTNDAEYNYGGMRGWNYDKYQKKQQNIAKVIVSIGEWEAPALVGLCEVESEKCMRDLTRYSGLKSLAYKYVHFESPDPRGVDVALLYQPDLFEVIAAHPVRIHFPNAPASHTRDILYAKGKVPVGDTLHVFVCHFPSRLGGELESEDKRLYVASVLKGQVDSVFRSDTDANIIIMGDFNDYPDNESMAKVLKAQEPQSAIVGSELYNLMFPIHKAGRGSHKHNGEWGALDQIIVSGNLLNPQNVFSTLVTDAHVFEAEFLLENDDRFLGKQPFRTYVGMKYQGGFADHLPVYIDFWY